ncbi:YhgE/Pip family protein [Melissococcus plutonius]|uniref:YhgE/Pip family protein n=1 Tax=Melissococcus plutonius TaxID=33970 RepID=UPI00065E033C|nr:YhgE/Pip family protein [Melissococcus plutonius]KMT40496.1 hypothetical protein MEPL12_2c01210 [Melissococcus plutonius]
MIKKEWKHISKNKLVIATLFIMMLIPALYSIIFLGSVWDPYGHLDRLPVAVVNQDKSADFESKKVAVGDDLTKKLKDDGSLDFHFVSSEKAKKGLENGDYYMKVTIPENFSKNATTILKKHPKPMNITYETTKGRGYTAYKMSDTAMMKMKNSVSSKVTEMYSKALLSQFGVIGKGMADASTGGNKLKTGTKKLEDASKLVAKNLDKLSSSSLQFSEGAQTLTVGIKQYVDGASQVDDGTQTLANGLTTLSDGVPALTNGMNQLNTGSTNLATGVEQYTGGVGSLSSASSQLSSGMNQLASKIPAMTNGVSKLSDGSKNLNKGVNQFVNGTGTISKHSEEFSDQLHKLDAQTSQLPENVQNLANGTQKLSDTLQATKMSEEQKNQLTTYVEGVHTYLAQVSELLGSMDSSSLDNSSAMKQNLINLSTDLNQLTNSVSSTSQQIEKAKTAIKTSYDQDLKTNADSVIATLEGQGVTLNDAQKSSVLSAMKNQNSQMLHAADQISIDTAQLTSTLSTVKDNLNNIEHSTDKTKNISEADINKLKAESDKLAAGSSTATPGLSNVVNGMYKLSNSPDIERINQGATALANNVPRVSAGIHQFAESSTELAAGTTKLSENGKSLINGTTNLSNGLTAVGQGLPALSSGVNQLATGTNQLNQGTKQLASKSGDLTKGANQLSTGLETIDQKMPTLGSGINKLADGSKQLASGASQLKSNGGKLVSGSDKLGDGANQIAGGGGQLASGETQIAGSLGKVKTGLSDLSGSLAKGANGIKKVNTKKNSANALASPVKSNHKDKNTVADNGTGMAPYLLSLALFVGAITMNVIFDAFKPKSKPTNGVAWWASKMSVLGLVSLVQAVFAYCAVLLLGMHSVHPAKLFFLLLVTAITFMSIVTLLNVVLSKLGSFLALILLLFQLSGSGGTYPIQLSGGFYQFIHPFLPMTYSINAIRQCIGMDGSVTPDLLVLLVLLVISNLLMILFFSKNVKNPKLFIDEDWENAI